MTDKPMTAMQGWRQIGVFAIGFIVLTAAVLWSPWNNLIDSVDALTIKVEHATQTMAAPAPAWEAPLPVVQPTPSPDTGSWERVAEEVRELKAAEARRDAAIAELKEMLLKQTAEPAAPNPSVKAGDVWQYDLEHNIYRREKDGAILPGPLPIDPDFMELNRKVDKLWDWASKTTERVNAKHEYFGSRIDRLEKALSQKTDRTDQPQAIDWFGSAKQPNQQQRETPPSYESRQVVPRYRTEGTPGVPGGDTYRPDQVPRMLIPQNTPR